MQNQKQLKFLVKKLYKQIIFSGRNYPGGLDYIRKRAKEEFFKNKDVQDPEEIKVYFQNHFIIFY